MYKDDLTLNNLQWLICHKTKLEQKPASDFMSNFAYIFFINLELFRQYRSKT